jgi:acyl-coenzyme A synthetase/AMP-(fatty) acid ligase
MDLLGTFEDVTDGAEACKRKTKDKSKKIKVEENKNDLSERLFEFAVRVIEFLKTIPYTPENKIIREQLAKSATSSGANYSPCQIASNC